MNLIASIVGALGAITYVGFFAYKIGKLPLTVIVIIGLCLMVYSFYHDYQTDRARAQARNDDNSS